MSGPECPGDKLRGNANKWTLADDAQLLDYMRLIADSVTTRCRKTGKDLTRMSLSLDAASVALSNTSNKLLTLQHKQFVENRVYDEDETVKPTPETTDQQNNNAETQMTPMQALEIAIENGIKVMNRFYDKVSINLDGSDDEDDEVNISKSVIFRPKDPYENKAIPYIIGSKEWREKWHVGLMDSDDDDDVELNAGNNNEIDGRSMSSFSGSESSSLPVSLPSHMMSGSESSMWDLHTPQPSGFDRKSLLESPRPQAEGRSSNVEKVEPMPRQQVNINNNNEYIERKRVALDLFADEPPPMDARPAPRRPVNLFDESDDDDELPVVSTEAPKPKPRNALNLFNDNDFNALMNDDVNHNDAVKVDVPKKIQDTPKLSFLDELNRKLPGKSQNQKAAVAPKSESKPIPNVNKDLPKKTKRVEKEDKPKINFDAPKKNVKSLFDDDDDDDYTVQSLPKSAIPTTSAKSSTTKGKGLFDDYSSDDNFDIFHNLSKNAAQGRQKKQNLFFEDSDNEDTSSQQQPEENTMRHPPVANPIIFDEPPEDDIESAKAKETQRLFSGGLFDDEVDYFDDIFRRPAVKGHGLFDDDKDDHIFETKKTERNTLTKPGSDDIFSESKSEEESKRKEKLEHEKKVEVAKQLEEKEKRRQIEEVKRTQEVKKIDEKKLLEKRKGKVEKIQKQSLFGDDSDDDMFSPKNKAVSKSNNSSNESDLSNAQIDSVSNKKPQHLTQQEGAQDKLEKNQHKSLDVIEKVVPKLNLFDDDTPDDEFDDLFRKPQAVTRTLSKDDVKSFTITNLEENHESIENENASNSAGMDESSVTKDDETINSSKNCPPANSVFPELEATSETIPNTEIEIQSTPKQNSLPDDFTEYDPFAPPEDIEYHLSRNYTKTENQMVDSFTNNYLSSDTLSVEASQDLSPENQASIKKPDSNVRLYDSIGLFDDLPPDDDLDFLPPDIKTGMSTSFEDDYPEPIEESMGKSGFQTESAFMLDDEPPPVDPIREIIKSDNTSLSVHDSSLKTSTAISVASDKKQQTVDDFPRKIISKRSLSSDKLKELQTTDDSISEKAPKRSPGKLNKSLNINVAALLPGIKVPSFKKGPLDAVDPIKQNVVETETEVVGSYSNVTHTETIDVDTGRLNSLTKSRAKIQVKRRPSSAQARKENYRKSIVLESVEPDELNDDGTKISDELKKSNELESSGADNQNVIATVSNLLEQQDTAIKTKTPFEDLFNNDVLDDGDIFFQGNPKISLPNKAELNPSSDFKKKPTLSDEFKSVTETQNPNTSKFKEPVIEKTTETKVISSKAISSKKLFGSDEEDDDSDIFSKSQKSNQSKKIEKSKEKVGTKQQQQQQPFKQPSKVVSLFGSDDDDDESLFQSALKSKPNKLKTATILSTSKKASLFGESDEDDEELFQTKKNIPRPQQSVRAVSSTQKQVKSAKAVENDPLADLLK